MAGGLPKGSPITGGISFSPSGRQYVDISYAGKIYAQREAWREHNGQEVSNLGLDLFPRAAGKPKDMGGTMLFHRPLMDVVKTVCGSNNSMQTI